MLTFISAIAVSVVSACFRMAVLMRISLSKQVLSAIHTVRHGSSVLRCTMKGLFMASEDNRTH